FDSSSRTRCASIDKPPNPESVISKLMVSLVSGVNRFRKVNQPHHTLSADLYKYNPIHHTSGTRHLTKGILNLR
ncbi:MAG: hypothetical protein QF691_12130, partial [SAR324 cluster bacterium]|nr:hypothetical protein [SAR324 cluster bacterium]